MKPCPEMSSRSKENIEAPLWLASLVQEYSSDHPREQWSYLKKGIMVDADVGGVIIAEKATMKRLFLSNMFGNSGY